MIAEREAAMSAAEAEAAQARAKAETDNVGLMGVEVGADDAAWRCLAMLMTVIPLLLLPLAATCYRNPLPTASLSLSDAD